MKMNEWEKVMNTCTSILERDPNNVKALFRRGRAHIFRQNLDLVRTNIDFRPPNRLLSITFLLISVQAKVDLNAAKKLAPEDVDVARELQVLAQKYKEAEEKEKAMYRGVMKNMFG